MLKKVPRRTAERILETALELFNRFGEPNVSTTLISSEMGISPGNLYYHYPSKDELINSLFNRFEVDLTEFLTAWEPSTELSHMWEFLNKLFERLWQYRFLYRDLNDLLSKNRRLETHFQTVLDIKGQAIKSHLRHLMRTQTLSLQMQDVDSTVTSIVVMLTYWLSFEYVRDPRHALEAENAKAAMARGAHQVLNLLLPYLDSAQRQSLIGITSACNNQAAQNVPDVED